MVTPAVKHRRKSNRVVLSFAITIGSLVIALIVGILFFPGGSGVVTRHIPETIPRYSSIIGDYTPSDALQVSYNNFSAIRNINRTALPAGNYLVFKEPALNISANWVEFRVSVVMSRPNATVDVTILDAGAFDTISAAFELSALARSRVGQYVLFTASELASGKATAVWVTMLSRTRAFVSSVGALPAHDAVTRVLSVYSGAEDSLLAKEDVQREFYVANGTANHLAVGIQNYAGAVTTGKMTLITVDKVVGSLAVNYIVKFSDSVTAESQLKYFQTVYLGAEKFATYDDILAATEAQPVSSLIKAVSLVG